MRTVEGSDISISHVGVYVSPWAGGRCHCRSFENNCGVQRLAAVQLISDWVE